MCEKVLIDSFFLFSLLQNSDILNLGTGSVSWFEVNGYGCRPVYPTNITAEDPYLIRPDRVEDCLLEYHIMEIVHSGVQCFLAVRILFILFYLNNLFGMCAKRRFNSVTIISIRSNGGSFVCYPHSYLLLVIFIETDNPRIEREIS